jgi:hypothetical protein
LRREGHAQCEEQARDEVREFHDVSFASSIVTAIRERADPDVDRNR